MSETPPPPFDADGRILRALNETRAAARAAMAAYRQERLVLDRAYFLTPPDISDADKMRVEAKVFADKGIEVIEIVWKEHGEGGRWVYDLRGKKGRVSAIRLEGAADFLSVAPVEDRR